MRTEEIIHAHVDGGEGLLAVVLWSAPSPHGIHFVTGPDGPLQVATIRRPAGAMVAPHVHRAVQRTVQTQTQELLIVRGGRIAVDFFARSGEHVCQRELLVGDMVLLLHGGHGLTILEDAEIVEVKQGPYAGAEDKVYLDGSVSVA